MAASREVIKRRALSWLKQLFAFVLALLLVSLAVDWYRAPTVPAGAAAMPLQPIGAKQAQTLQEYSSDQVLVLYFWGSWCGICRHTSPAIEKLRQDGVPVVGVAMNSGSDADIGNYLRRNGWHFASVNDADGHLSRQWGVHVTPTIVLVRNGKVRHSTTGLAAYPTLKARIWLANLLP